MPLYEYKCQGCGERFEELVSNGQREAICCPYCSSSEVQRLLSTFGFSTGTASEATSGSTCSGCSSRSCSTCRL